MFLEPSLRDFFFPPQLDFSDENLPLSNKYQQKISAPMRTVFLAQDTARKKQTHLIGNFLLRPKKTGLIFIQGTEDGVTGAEPSSLKKSKFEVGKKKCVPLSKTQTRRP